MSDVLEYSYGIGGSDESESWHLQEQGFPSRSKALGAAHKMYEYSGVICTYRVERPTIGHYVAAYGAVLWESIIEDAFAEAGEVLAEDWNDNLDLSHGCRAMCPAEYRANEIVMEDLNFQLRKTVEAWADRHGMQPTFFLMREIREHAEAIASH